MLFVPSTEAHADYLAKIHSFSCFFYILYPGAGIYAIRADSPGPITNNGLILSAEYGIVLDCVSDSSQSGVGAITTPAGASGWRTAYPFSRPGLIRYRRESSPLPLPASDQGIYTCTIPDSTGQNIVLNVGLYPPDFSGELTHYYILDTLVQL